MKIRLTLFTIVCLLLLSACNGNQPYEKKIDTFSFIDQNERSFGTEQLAGTVWIASFIFANCETVCPPMMFEMATLQKEIEKSGLKVEFVTFTVDPKNDTPEVLREYVQQFTNNEANWHMLTGYTQNDIETFARDQFQTIVQKPKSSDQVIHGTNFYVIDDNGYIRNEYNYTDDSTADEIIEEIEDIYP